MARLWRSCNRSKRLRSSLPSTRSRSNLYEFLASQPTPRRVTDTFQKFVVSSERHSYTTFQTYFVALCHLMNDNKVSFYGSKKQRGVRGSMEETEESEEKGEWEKGVSQSEILIV